MILEGTEGCRMATQYFRKKDPCAEGSAICWIEMTGQEFYAFVNSAEAEGAVFYLHGR